MSEHTDEDGALLYISCDAAPCEEYLTKREVAFGYTPAPHTGWIAAGEGASRRYYCEAHLNEVS